MFGYNIPDDFSIIGVNRQDAKFIEYDLNFTSMKIPAREMGIDLVKTLLEIDKKTPLIQKKYKTTIVEMDSVKDLNK